MKSYPKHEEIDKEAEGQKRERKREKKVSTSKRAIKHFGFTQKWSAYPFCSRDTQLQNILIIRRR